MKIKSSVFNRSAADLKSCPQSAMPEVAFIGRSNVGKSSLINLITERRDLAKVSGTPGKTKLLNFFTVNGNWSLVDLPGYGYAKVSQQQRYEFSQAVSEYLEKRENLRCVFVLIDSRLEPQDIDVVFVRWLERCDVPLVLVFTKTDKESASRVQRSVDLFTRQLTENTMAMPEVILTSVKSKAGRAEILARIERAFAG